MLIQHKLVIMLKVETLKNYWREYSVNEFKNNLLQSGSIMVEDLRKVPAGCNMTVKHPDGTIIEYVERMKAV